MLRHSQRACTPVSDSHNPISERLNSRAILDASRIYWRPRIGPLKMTRPAVLKDFLVILMRERLLFEMEHRKDEEIFSFRSGIGLDCRPRVRCGRRHDHAVR